MHKARIFLVACAGVFLLALSYHFGVRSVEAKTAPAVAAASIVPTGGGVAFVAAKGRVVHIGLSSSLSGFDTVVLPRPVPGRAPIVAVGTDGGYSLDRMGVYAMLDDGEVYVTSFSKGAWMRIVPSPTGEEVKRWFLEKHGLRPR